MLRSALLGLLLFSSTGCGLFNQLRLEPIATSIQKPSNVAVYVAVTQSGKPITNLQPESFRIYENGLLLSGEDAQQVLLPQEAAVYHHTVLLLDVSGETSSLESLSRAVAGFVEKVRSSQSLTVFTFDGRPGLQLVAEFPKTADRGAADLRALTRAGQADGSRNLNGALRSGLKELDARLAQQPKPLKVGTLVVFTRGADLAGRVSQADADNALRETKHDVLAVGIAEHAASTLAAIGTAGVIKAQDADSVGVALEEAASKTRDLYEKHYLIAYCSPARGGIRRLKVEAHFRDEEGDEAQASFDTDFDATGFGPGCHSATPPRFVSRLSVNASKPASTPAANEDDPVVPPPDKPGYAH